MCLSLPEGRQDFSPALTGRGVSNMPFVFCSQAKADESSCYPSVLAEVVDGEVTPSWGLGASYPFMLQPPLFILAKQFRAASSYFGICSASLFRGTSKAALALAQTREGVQDPQLPLTIRSCCHFSAVKERAVSCPQLSTGQPPTRSLLQD